MPNTLLEHLLAALIIDLTTVKVFVWVVMLYALVEVIALVAAIVMHERREDRLMYACHMMLKLTLGIFAMLILYSKTLEVYVT